MYAGHSDNVEYRGRTFHAQTEHVGNDVVTTLFLNGCVITSRTRKGPHPRAPLFRIISAQHRAVLADLFRGRFDVEIDAISASVATSDQPPPARPSSLGTLAAAVRARTRRQAARASGPRRKPSSARPAPTRQSQTAAKHFTDSLRALRTGYYEEAYRLCRAAADVAPDHRGYAASLEVLRGLMRARALGQGLPPVDQPDPAETENECQPGESGFFAKEGTSKVNVGP